MTKLTTLAVALIVGIPYLASAETILGEVIELSCAKGKGQAGVGTAHKECALKCVSEGHLLGIRSGDVVYEVHGPYSGNKYEKLSPMIAQQVEATGKVAVTKDGKKRVFVAKEIKVVK